MCPDPDCQMSLGVKPKFVYDRTLQSCVDKLFPEFIMREQAEAEHLQYAEKDAEAEAGHKRARVGSAADGASIGSSSKDEVVTKSGDSGRASSSSSSATKETDNDKSKSKDKSQPFVLVTMKIPPSAHLANVTSATLRVQLNSDLRRLKQFLIHKYSPAPAPAPVKDPSAPHPNSSASTSSIIMDALSFQCVGRDVVSCTNESTLITIAKAVGFTGEVDAENHALLRGSRLALTLQGTWSATASTGGSAKKEETA